MRKLGGMNLHLFAASAALLLGGMGGAQAQYSDGTTHVQLNLDTRARVASGTTGQGGLYGSGLSLKSRLGSGLSLNYWGAQNNHAAIFGTGGRFNSFITQEATLQKDWKDQQLQLGIIRMPFGLSNFSEMYASGVIDYPLIRGEYQTMGVNWGVPGIRFNGGSPNLRIEAAAFGGQGAGVWGNMDNLSGASFRVQGYYKDFIVGLSRWDGTMSAKFGHPTRGGVHFTGVDLRYTRPHLLVRGEYLFGQMSDEHPQGGYVDIYYHLPKYHRWTLVARMENFRAALDDSWMNQWTLGFRYTMSRDWVFALNWRTNNGRNYGYNTWTPGTAGSGDVLFQVYRKLTY